MVPTGDKARVHVTIHGRVQGVYFRASAVEQARRLNLTGWVRNRFDGSVEAVAEGARANVEEFLTWCHRGPPGARVVNVKADWEPVKGEFLSFHVKYD
jgi:acylphosphatase